MIACAEGRKGFFTARRIARMAVFVALSVVGAFIKIPSPTGTVAMDSCPGYFSALAWGYREGATVIALGHLATAATVGFPLGVLHLLIAILMSVAAVLFRVGATLAPRKWNINLIAAILLGGTFNGLMALMMSPLLGLGLAIAITPSLLVASYIDTAIAAIAYGIVSRTKMV